MENASKALIFAASTLIAIILLSFMVYIFRRFGITARNTEKRYTEQEIQAFNAKFLNYETGGNHTLADQTSITNYRKRGSEEFTISYSYEKIFKSPRNITNDEYYYKALVAASQTLNTCSDVVTAINDAININDINNRSYQYDYLEIQNSIEIIVDLGSYKNSFDFNPSHYQYLVIEPNRDVKASTIYAINSIETSGTNSKNKEKNVMNKFSTAKAISVYDMLDELRNTKIITVNNRDYMVYEYYFFGEVITNEATGLIETIKFTLVKDKNFDD